MPDACYPIEELADIARLDPQDPRLQHADRCARCRSLLTTYREFVAPSRVREGSDPEDAQARLSAFVDDAILKGRPLAKDLPDEARDQTMTGAGSQDHTIERPPVRPGNPFARFLLNLKAQPLRPAVAVAGTLAMVLLLLTLGDFGDQGPDRIVLREEAGEGAGVGLESPQILTGGRICLTWQPAAGADAYQVILLGHELDELARLEAGAATSLTFLPSDVPDLPGSGSAILWRVAAMRAGDEIARSPVQSMRLP
jgi:hypothetical protein